jgi:integrase
MRTPKKRRYPNVSSFTDRHGKVRWRWRKAGHPTYYFTTPPDTPGFAAELKQAEAGARISPGEGRAIPRSVADLASRYYSSPNHLGTSEADRHRRRLILDPFVAEFGKDMVGNFRWDHIERIIARKMEKRPGPKGRLLGGPVAAHSLRKQLLRLFAYAVKLGWISENPVALADKVKVPKTGGYHSWTEDEIAQYRAHHPLGTTARLALEIMLWTFQRRGDARLFGPQHIREGQIQYRQGKTKKCLWLPAAPQLLDAIRAMPKTGIRTYLITEAGNPFTAAGFGNRVRDWCDAAGLPHCTAHGLRKAAARRAADLGISQQGLKAAGGWSGDSEVAIYTAGADQKAMATQAIQAVSRWELANLQPEVSQSSRAKD